MKNLNYRSPKDVQKVLFWLTNFMQYNLNNE